MPSLLRKTRTALGFDLGGCHVKAVVVENARGVVRLRQAIMLPVKPGLIEQGRIQDPESLAAQVREILGMLPIRHAAVATAVPGRFGFLKQHSMPRLANVEKAIESLQGDRSLGLMIGDKDRVGVHILDPGAEGPLMQALVVAAKRDAISEHQRVFFHAAVPLNTVTLDAVALCNAHTYCAPATERRETLVHIGHESTLIVVVEEGRLVFMHSAPGGVARLIDDIRNSGRFGSTDPEEAVRQPDVRALHANAFEPWVEDLAQIINESSNFDRADRDIAGEIQLSGGGALIPGIVEGLGEALHAPIALFNPFDHLDATAIPRDELPNGPCYAVAIGLALQEAVPE